MLPFERNAKPRELRAPMPPPVIAASGGDAGLLRAAERREPAALRRRQDPDTWKVALIDDAVQLDLALHAQVADQEFDDVVRDQLARDQHRDAGRIRHDL